MAEGKKKEGVVPANIRISYKDIGDDIHEAIVQVALKALKQYDSGEKEYYADLAHIIKEEIDSKFTGTWHVVVGRSFGSFFTHELQKVTYFWVGDVGFLCWQHG